MTTETEAGISSENGRRLHALMVELAAMAQNGLNYTEDRYDRHRYDRIQGMCAEVMAMLAASDAVEFRAALAAENGHATPKVDVRGALVEGDTVLLVRERRDGRWTLPGGWADAMDSPAAATEREFAEEAGLAVRATKLIAAHDGSRHNGHARSPWHVYKLFFLVERLERGPDAPPPVAGLDGETTDVGFFTLDDLPELSTTRCTAEQLALVLDHSRDPARPADFD